MPKLSLKTKTLNVLRSVAKFKFVESFLLKLIKRNILPQVVKKIVPNNYQYNHGTFRNANIKGLNYLLDISDYMEHQLYFELESENYKPLLKLIEPGNIVFDIGVNIGNTALEIAARSKGGFVYGFEPVPFLYNKALANVKLNSFNNIEIVNAAVSSAPGFVYFDDFQESFNRGGIFMSHNKKEHKVPAIDLDSFVESRKIKHIDVLKADIEGFEMEMLKGASQTLKKFMPLLFLEFNDSLLQRAGSSGKELITYLNELGYVCFNAETDAKIAASDPFDNLHIDIIARHDTSLN